MVIRRNSSGETLQHFISNQPVAALTRAIFLLLSPSGEATDLPFVLTQATYSLWLPAVKILDTKAGGRLVFLYFES